jgi:hypothetical protein
VAPAIAQSGNTTRAQLKIPDFALLHPRYRHFPMSKIVRGVDG